MRHISVLLMLFLLSCNDTSVSSPESSRPATPQVSWKLSSSFPMALETFWTPLKNFSERVDGITKGNFKIRLYQPGELVPALEVFDAVQQGSIEMGQTGGGYYIGKNLAFSFDTGLPFGFNPRQQNSWLYSGGGLELLQELYKKHGIMYFPIGNTGPQMGGWFREEVNSVKDLKGRRMRLQGIGGEIMARMGMTIQNLGGGEIYTSLEQGTIDAAEFIGPHDDKIMGFNEIAPYYYYPGWWEPGATIALYINLSDWESLPEYYKKAIEVASKEANSDMLAMYDRLNAEAFEELIKSGTIIKKFDESILSEAEKISLELYNEYSKESEDFKKIYDSWVAFKEKTDFWFKLDQ